MSTQIQISPQTAITIGTTPITSGVAGRVLFEGAGNVVQEDGGLFWDNVNKRLGVGATPATTLDVKGSATSGFDVIRFQSQYSKVGFLGTDNGQAWLSSGTGQSESWFSVGSTQARIKSNNTIFFNGSSVEIAKFGGTMDGFNIGPSATPQAKLDVRAQGALSTDIAFRVRNSADTADLLSLNGLGNLLINTTTDAGYKLDVNGTARVATSILVGSGSGTGTVQTGVCRATYFNEYNNNYTIFEVKSNGNASFYQGIAVGTTSNAVASAQVEIVSTTKGFLPPRMTNAQRLAIASPAIGLMVYCTDAVEGLYVNKSTGWTFII
jgi:hypothetical protein